jgi:hypothetical protein
VRARSIVPLSAALVLLATGCETGDERGPLTAGQRTGGEDVERAAADEQGGVPGPTRSVTLAEHTLGEDRGFLVTASAEDGQVCLTAAPERAGMAGPDGVAVTDCGSPDTPLDVRVLRVADDLEVLAGVVTDERVTDVYLLDVAGEPVADEADAVPLVDLPGTDHRAFAAASEPAALSEVRLADAEGADLGSAQVPD